jgi:hypothetical protein
MVASVKTGLVGADFVEWCLVHKLVLVCEDAAGSLVTWVIEFEEGK